MEISSLTTYDNVTITATFMSLTEDKFRCSHRLKELTKREGEANAKKRMQIENGCGVCRSEYRYDVDGIRFHQCFCGYRSHNMGFYLDLEDKFSKGILPFEGSYLDQPAKVIEIINRISALKMDKKERDLLEQQKQINKGN